MKNISNPTGIFFLTYCISFLKPSPIKSILSSFTEGSTYNSTELADLNEDLLVVNYNHTTAKQDVVTTCNNLGKFLMFKLGYTKVCPKLNQIEKLTFNKMLPLIEEAVNQEELTKNKERIAKLNKQLPNLFKVAKCLSDSPWKDVFTAIKLTGGCDYRYNPVWIEYSCNRYGYVNASKVCSYLTLLSHIHGNSLNTIKKLDKYLFEAFSGNTPYMPIIEYGYKEIVYEFIINVNEVKIKKVYPNYNFV